MAAPSLPPWRRLPSQATIGSIAAAQTLHNNAIMTDPADQVVVVDIGSDSDDAASACAKSGRRPALVRVLPRLYARMTHPPSARI